MIFQALFFFLQLLLYVLLLCGWRHELYVPFVVVLLKHMALLMLLLVLLMLLLVFVVVARF